MRKEQKVVRSYKSSFQGSFKVGFQLFFLSNYFIKGGSSYEKDMKGRYHQLFNLLLQLSKDKKGAKGPERLSQGVYHFPDELPYQYLFHWH